MPKVNIAASAHWLLPLLVGALLPLSAQGQSLGAAGTFNAFVLGSFTSSGSDTQGALAIGGNANLSSYDVNGLNVKGSGGTALYVGGNLTTNAGSIKNGTSYIGGTNSQTNTGHVNSTQVFTPQFDFNAAAQNILNLSASLSHLQANGHASFPAWGGSGLYLTGDGTSNPQIFNLTSSQVNSLTYYNFGNLTNGQTLVLNVSGPSSTLNSGNWDFSNYNAVINFYEASSLTYNGAGLKGTLLAPLATVNGASGLIVGDVIVGNWTGQTQINTGNGWKDTNIPGYSPVPEPSGIFFIVSSGLLFLMRRNRRVVA